tara:strand:+ start:15524 stop:16570 length:1047 start_codon:yes stop_codon:yes gene_type:complete
VSKTILLGDMHVGATKDSPYVYKIIEHGLKQVVEYAKKHNIRRLIQAGDWFDTRKAVSQVAMEFNRYVVMPMLESQFTEIIVLVGNHDMHYRQKISPNSVEELLGDYDSVTVVDTPMTLDMGKFQFDLFPWMCDENREQIMEFIKNSNSDFSLGHWELDGYEFYRGIRSSGDDPQFLRKYDLAYSGHYHTINGDSTVQYLGTPYTLTMGDANDPRGFFVFDDETGTHEIVYNTETWHYKLYFDANTWDKNPKDYAGKRVHLVVENLVDDNGKKTNIDKIFDKFESVCETFGYTYDQEIQEAKEDEEVDVKARSFNEIVDNRVDIMEEPDEVKKRVKSIMLGLRTEVQQ